MVIMSLDVYEREIAKNQVIHPINESLKDKNSNDGKIKGSNFINEMKEKYGK